jgi:hypothetical protein
MVARNISVGRNLEEPGSGGWPVLFWLCRVEIEVQTFIDVFLFHLYFTR